MKKLILIVFTLITLNVYSQTITKKAFSPAFELGIPSTGVYSIGVGASVKGELPIVAPVNLTLTAGFNSLFYKSNLFSSSRTPGAAVFVPLKAGIKYYFNTGVYLEGEGGTAIETNYGKQSSFAFSIGPGFLAQAGNKNALDISFRYESWANQLRQTVIKIAYCFGQSGSAPIPN